MEVKLANGLKSTTCDEELKVSLDQNKIQSNLLGNPPQSQKERSLPPEESKGLSI